jgi:hypothetical protein
MAITFTGSASSPVMVGNDLVEQNLFLIENGIRSRVNVIVKRLTMQNDPIVVLTTVMPLIKMSRVDVSASPVVGLNLSKAKFDTSQTSDAAVKVWCDSLYAPLAVDESTIIWEQYNNRLHTAIGQILAEDNLLIPPSIDVPTEDFILVPGHGLLIQVVAPTAASNASGTNNYVVQAIWEEDSLPTFNISGTVTLSAVPVVGAKVIIFEADDEALTNPVLWEVKTTTAGGVWNSSIRSGKVGAAFVQYVSGGTYYTAPGSPFLEA